MTGRLTVPARRAVSLAIEVVGAAGGVGCDCDCGGSRDRDGVGVGEPRMGEPEVRSGDVWSVQLGGRLVKPLFEGG